MSSKQPHIVRQTVYNHKPNQATPQRQFSFLMDTNLNQTTEGEQEQPDLFLFLNQLKQINESLTCRMDRMDQEITSEIEKQSQMKNNLEKRSQLYEAGKSMYSRHGLVGINTENEEMFGYKSFLLENKQFQTSSNFQIDEHQNFVKIRNGQSAPNFIPHCISHSNKTILPNVSMERSSRISFGKQNKFVKTVREAPRKPRKGVYESILSKYSTASLLAMSKDQSDSY